MSTPIRFLPLLVALVGLLSCSRSAPLEATPEPLTLDAPPAPPPPAPDERAPDEPAPDPLRPAGPPSCDDRDPCTKDKSTKAGCVHEPDLGAKCDDGNACTSKDQCEAAHGGGAVCAGTPRPAGSSCDDDRDACNGTATCDATAHCIAQPPVVIDDDNPCTVDSCNPRSGKSKHE